MEPQPELTPVVEGLTLMLTIGTVALLVAVGSITLIGFRRYYRERWTFQGDWSAPSPSQQPESLVTRMKMGSDQNTVSVFESDGKSRILIEGRVSDREKKRLIRYLKSEGFI